ncbi:GRIM-19 protein-domain-containing protein [Phlyctochytrium arcticum]|nr:GRIM-19 protein-domain-containing protein [Phlyctochytrium arcticum]
MAANVQDLPPPGGFPQTIQYKRYLPRRGPSGLVIFVASFAVMGYGWYWVAKANAERRELRREKAWNRINLVPLLQAETDRDLVRRLEAAKEREAEIMASYTSKSSGASRKAGDEDSKPAGWAALDLKAAVPGIGKNGLYDAKAAEPIYHTDKYVNPSFVFLPWESDARVASQWWRGTKMFMKNPEYHDRPDFTKEHPIGQ